MVSENTMDPLSNLSTPTPSLSSSQPNKESITLLNLPVTTKLTRTNYLSSQSQIVPLLHGYDLYSFIHPIAPAPNPTRTGESGQVEFNSAYMTWHKQDQILLGWLRASLTEQILAQVVSCSSSSQLWSALQRSFASTSRAKLTELRRNLQTISKGASSCTDYLHKIQSISDELAFIGFPVSDEDQVTHILNSLGSDFNSFIVAITALAEPINLYDLHSLLLSHEQLIQNQNIASAAINSSATAFYAHSQAPGRWRPRGPRPQNNFGPQQSNFGPPRSSTNSFRPSFPPRVPSPHNGAGVLPSQATQSKSYFSPNPYDSQVGVLNF